MEAKQNENVPIVSEVGRSRVVVQSYLGFAAYCANLGKPKVMQVMDVFKYTETHEHE